MCLALFFPLFEHALYEKGLQRQKDVGSLVSSQERRAGNDPRIKPLVKHEFCSSIDVLKFSLIRASEGTS